MNGLIRHNSYGRFRELNIFRVAAIIFTQLPMIFFLGGKFDLLFGFNQTHAGFSTLIVLFVMVPLLNLFWLICEIALSVKKAKRGARAASFIMPIIALFFFIESIGIDLYLLSQARM